MIIMLKVQGLQSLGQVCAFIEGTNPSFEVPERGGHDWIANELRRLCYPRLGKADKGLGRYLESS